MELTSNINTNQSERLATLRLKQHLKKIPFAQVLGKKFLQFNRDLLRRIELFRTINQLYYQFYAKNVEYYQPLYHFAIFPTKTPQRICFDRADTIYQHLKPWGQGAKILDIGVSLGYFAFYFSERGYQVDGIDQSKNNVAVCQLINRIAKRPIHFMHAEFSENYLKHLNEQYDIAFLFSVVHHIIYHHGLSYAQDLMKKLLDTIPVLFIELAVKNEETTSPWRQHLPINELDIFAKCTDITIENIGYFPNHLSAVWRPLYLVKKNKLNVGNNTYDLHSHQYTAYKNADYLGRHFYNTENVFIKKYLIKQNNDNKNQIEQEIKLYQSLPTNEFFPKLLEVHRHEQFIEVMFTKMPGNNVHNLLSQGQSVPAWLVFNDVMRSLNYLYEQGIYHNDVRLWNVLFDGKRAYLLDLGLANNAENENTNLALLWMIAQLHHFLFCDFPYPLNSPPVLIADKIAPEFIPIIAALKSTTHFADFLDWFKQEYKGDHC